LRDTTKRCRLAASPVMMSSVIPSARNSCSESFDMLAKGSTAMDGLSVVCPGDPVS
jgi:hypothetical protein